MSDTKQDRNRKVKSRQLAPRDESPVQEKRTDGGAANAARSTNVNRNKNRKKRTSQRAGGQQSRKQQSQKATGQQGQKRIVTGDQQSGRTKAQPQNQKQASKQQTTERQKNVAAQQSGKKDGSQQTLSKPRKQRPRKRHFDNIDEKKIRAVETVDDVRRDIEQIERSIRLDIDGIQTISLDL